MTTTILIADADPFNLAQLEECCSERGHRVLTAGDGEQVLSSVAREPPDVILLQAELPALSGLQVLNILREDPILRGIRVVIITDAANEDSAAQALNLGADDVLTHPYAMPEVPLRIEAALRQVAAAAHLAQAQPSAQPESIAPGRHDLRTTLAYEWRRAERYGHNLSCLVLRVANLRDLVAQGGAAASDQSMSALELGIRSLIREVDYVFRSAQGEFTLILPETSAIGAEALAQRTLTRWAADRLGLPEEAPALLLELGHASRDPEGDGVKDIDKLQQDARDRTASC